MHSARRSPDEATWGRWAWALWSHSCHRLGPVCAGCPPDSASFASPRPAPVVFDPPPWPCVWGTANSCPSKFCPSPNRQQGPFHRAAWSLHSSRGLTSEKRRTCTPSLMASHLLPHLPGELSSPHLSPPQGLCPWPSLCPESSRQTPAWSVRHCFESVSKAPSERDL